MNWQLLLFMHMGFAACTSLQKRYLMVQDGANKAPYAIQLAMMAALYLGGLLCIPLLGGVDFTLAQQFSGTLVLGAVLFTVSGVCNLISFSHLDTAVASVLGTFNSLFAVLLAWLVLGERLSMVQLAGSLVLLLAIMYMMTVGSSKGKRRANNIKGMMFGIAAALLFALGLVVEKYAVSNVPVATYLVFGWGLQLLCAVIMVSFHRRQLKILRSRRVLGMATGLGVTGAAAGILFILAQLGSDNLSLVTTLANARIVLITLAAAWLLRERQYIRQRLSAAVVAVLGVSLLLWH